MTPNLDETGDWTDGWRRYIRHAVGATWSLISDIAGARSTPRWRDALIKQTLLIPYYQNTSNTLTRSLLVIR